MSKKTRVIMVGPKATVKGGITTVINGYKNDNQFNSSFLVKYYNSTISGNKIKKFFYCGWKLFLFPLFFLFFKPDIVHIHSSFGPSFTRKSLYLLISHSLGAKTIIHFHGADWGSFYESSSRKRRDRIKKILKRSDLVFVLSQEWKTNFSKLVPSQKIRIIPNFVNFKSSDVKREHFSNSIKIIFLGEFCERKGCFDISKIIENVPEKERIKMIFAGFGDTSTLKKTFPSKSKNYE
jgi:glycosyltransferase involved in cell wall biosynthesis